MVQIKVTGKRWQDSFGNTYHTCVIWVNGVQVASRGATYGYDEQYLETAFEWLDENGYTDRPARESGGRQPPYSYCKDAGIDLKYECTDVKKKRDL